MLYNILPAIPALGRRSAIALVLVGVLLAGLVPIPVATADSLPAGTSVTGGSYPSGGDIHVVVVSNPGAQTISFPDPSGPVEELFSTVTTYVSGAVLYFDYQGSTYSKSISPNSNTLMIFPEPFDISNVRMTIQDRGYPDDAVHAGYFYADEQEQESEEEEHGLPDGTDVSTGEPYPDEYTNVWFIDPGPQTKSIPSPENGEVIGIFATVTTYVEGAVLHFEADGGDYSWPIEPNSNTLLTFENEVKVDDVEISIDDRGYSDDQANIGYVYADVSDETEETGEQEYYNLPDSTDISTGEPYPEEFTNVWFTNPGPQTKSIPSPENGDVIGIFATVTTYVDGAVLHFEADGENYSWPITPNSNTLFTFENELDVNDVEIRIEDRGYSDDQANVGYTYLSAEQEQDQSEDAETEDQSSTDNDGLPKALRVSNSFNDMIEEALEEHGFEVDHASSIPSNLSGYDLVVVTDIGSKLQDGLDVIEDYVYEGGGYAYISGAAYWSQLESNSDWLGASSAGYTGYGESAYVTAGNPFGTPLEEGDLLKQQGSNEWGAQWVDGLASGADKVAEYSSGRTYAYTYEYGSGRVYYQADINSSSGGTSVESNILTLLGAGFEWAAYAASNSSPDMTEPLSDVSFSIIDVVSNKDSGAVFAPGEEISLYTHVYNTGSTSIGSYCLNVKIIAKDSSGKTVISGEGWNAQALEPASSKLVGFDSIIPSETVGWHSLEATVVLSDSATCGGVGDAKTRHHSDSFQVVSTTPIPPTEVPSLPDLTVSRLYLEPGDRNIGLKEDIVCQVTNIGTKNSGSFVIEFYVDGSHVLTKQVDNISLSSQKLIKANGAWTKAPGSHTFKCVVDSTSSVSESSESNNTYQQSFNFSGSAGPAATALSISVSPSAIEAETLSSVTVSGRLTTSSGGVPGKAVSVSLYGITRSIVTDGFGNYATTFNVEIPDPRNWNVEARFSGDLSLDESVGTSILPVRSSSTPTPPPRGDSQFEITSTLTSDLRPGALVNSDHANNRIIVNIVDNNGMPLSGAQVFLKFELPDREISSKFLESGPGRYELMADSVPSTFVGSHVGQLDASIDVSYGGLSRVTPIVITTLDGGGEFRIPPKGWFLDTEPLRVTVEGRQLVAYRMFSTTYDLKWLIIDESGGSISYDTYRKASLTAMISFMNFDPMTLREIARNERTIVAASNAADAALFVRDSAARALGAVGSAAATGGLSTVTTVPAAAKLAVREMAVQMLKDAVNEPERLLNDPVKVLRKSYEINLIADSLLLDWAADIHERNNGDLSDYKTAIDFYSTWKPGLIFGPMHATMVAETLPATDLATQLREVSASVVEGATGVDPNDVAMINDIADKLESISTISNAMSKSEDLGKELSSSLIMVEKSWSQIPQELIEYSRTAKLR